MKFLLLPIFLISNILSFAQTKIYEPIKITSSVKVDGKQDEVYWATANKITNFITASPNFGKPPKKETEVKIAYDNTAIYFFAILHDPERNIRKQLSPRDAIDRQDCDIFTIGLDTYQDKQNAFQFQVSSAGVQADAKVSNANGTDKSWDAVWESAVKMEADKWMVEIKIPFSAIRFPKKDVQAWGMQITRSIRSLNETITWSPLNPNVDGTLNQWGTLSNLKSITPPLRLSFLPYLSGGVRNSPTSNGGFTTEYLKSGGMDVKYGINESFTIDMTLIPDFAQVQSDNKFLNLSPFQVRFEDFRPFFTEGTELFNKAGLFYSRRIGAEPTGTQSVLDFARNNNEFKINKNPGITRLYNATKFSGRTKNNIGIAIFNAVTAPMKAKLTNSITKSDTTITTEPLTNYNVIVIDKALKNRSSLTFTNTNVMRNGNNRNANVASVDVELFDKTNKHVLFGSTKVSTIWGKVENYSGYKSEIGTGKVNGKWRWRTALNIESDKYDPNDLGFLLNNNSVEQSGEISINYNLPTKKYLIHNYSLSYNNQYLYKPFKWSTIEIEGKAFFLFKNFWDAQVVINTQPLDFNDFFESRTPGLKLNRFPYLFLGTGGSSDSRKKLYGSWFIGGAESRVKDDPYYKLDFSSRYRFNDRFQCTISYGREYDKGNWGFSHRDIRSTLVAGYNDPLIAFRTIKTNNLIASALYNFTPRMNWTIRMRHNWTNVENRYFVKLKADGNWDDIPFAEGRNRNFNVFNVDMFYTWDFKWGSRLTLGWKNALGNNVNLNPYTFKNYTRNLEAIFNNPHSNEVTLKIVYFLDYLDLKKK